MTTVVFDNETIIDAVTKAARIAPRLTSKTGHNAGVVIRVNPGDEEPVLIRATDGDVFWDQWVDTVEATGAPTEWRMLGDRLSAAVTGLPIGDNKRVTFSDEEGGNRIDIFRPRMKAWMAQIEADSYPVWEPFDDSDTQVVHNLGDKLDLLSWAVSKDDALIPWSGMQIDGKRILASDRYRFAAVECDIPLDVPVTLPMHKILPLIRHSGSVRLGVKDGNLLICPDEYSQVWAPVFAKNYPDCSHILDAEYEYQVTLDKGEVGAYVKRASEMAQRQQAPSMRIILGAGAMQLNVYGAFGTEGFEQGFDLPGVTHETIAWDVTPKMFADALASGTDNETTMLYDAEGNRRKPRMSFVSPGGYQAWIPGITERKAR